jgi:hypothetical protein
MISNICSATTRTACHHHPTGTAFVLAQGPTGLWGKCRWYQVTATMKPKLPQYLHLVARHLDGQWVVTCLDFDLAAQDDTLEAAQQRLIEQVYSYVQEALTMDGGAHAEQLLSRRAPLHSWILFRLGMILRGLHAARGFLQGYERPFQLQTA